jgi:hypothetical protein
VLENDPSPDPLIEHTRKQMESLRQPLAPKSAEALSQEVKSSRNFFDEHLKYTKKKATLSPFQMQELVRQKPLVLKVIEVTEKGFLGSPTFQEMRPMFIEMPDVAGITKGQEYMLMKMVEYRGSQSTPFNYQNTYRVLSDDEVQRIKEFLKARKIIKQTKFFRRWSDTQSGKTLEALFIDYEAGKVRLRTEEGQTVSIDRNRLSKKDLDWIAENFYYPLDR